ncbi:MAG: DNA polymerase III subunit chi [Gammaproteobacteria bacterium]
MSRVDFYVLAGGQPEAFACRLAEKISLLGHRVNVLVGSDEGARRLDDLMWTFRQDSFVPHALAGAATPGDPVVIHGAEEPSAELDVLINLTPRLPECAGRTVRILEIVGPDAESKAAARHRFRAYQERDFEIEHHKI